MEAFGLDRVQKAGARFDPDKIRWFNQKHLQQKSTETLVREFVALAEIEGWTEYRSASAESLNKMMALLQERLEFLSDFKELSAFFFHAPQEYDPKAAKKQWKEQTPALMKQVQSLLQEAEAFQSSSLQETIKSWCAENEIGLGKVMAPLRLSMVGSLQGPDLFQSIELLGKEESVQRIEKALLTL